ncbi:hypothetical protein GC176_04750 [bacterium]|nr:hypothetical protein [bacterium]
MDFESRLSQAIQRGEQTRDARQYAREQKALSEEELKNLHSAIRLELSEHIESGLRQLAEHFPGFRFETVVSEDGWGARISRDDLSLSRSRSSRRSETLYSRFQILVRPFSQQAKIIEAHGKGTIRNREILNRNSFQFLAECDRERFLEVIDQWILEYAEKFAAGE